MSNTAEMDVLAEVIRLIESTLKVPADQIDIDANLESFGVNSLIVMELMENIEKEFDITLTPAQFSNIDTIRGLTGLVESLLDEGMPATTTAAPPPSTAVPGLAGIGLPVAATADSAFAPVLEHVARTYDVQLSGRQFASLDQIVDSLLHDHADAMLRHYGMATDQTGAASRKSLVAIVGMSCRLPDAPDPHTFWNNLLAGRNSVREVPDSRWDWKAHYSETPAQGKSLTRWAALIDDVDCFDAEFFRIAPEEAASIDPQLRLLMEETYRAVEDAGIDMRSLAGSRTGVFVGYEYAEYEHHLRKLDNQDMMKGPLFSSSSPTYYLANRISHTFDLCGPSEAFNVNCASSAVAINRAFHSLLDDESDVALVGAASLNLFEGDYIAASQYGVLSPDGSSGVFDDDANGFTRGEGVATLVLKRLEDAERDNDRIYGLIRASHQNYRGAARNISEVKHESITRVLQDCYRKAGLSPDAIDYVEVDGYASKWADSFEYEGIKGAFAGSGVGRKHLALGSMKGNIGNLEPVSGIANVIKLALSLHHKRFPATISMKKVNTFIDIANPAHPLYIADRQIAFDEIRRDERTPVRAGINSFADSGSNVHILLEEYMPRPRSQAEADGGKQLFVLSARNAQRLERYVHDYIAFLGESAGDGSEQARFADLVHTAQTGREAQAERLAIVASSRKELLDKLQQVAKVGIREKLGLESKEIFHGRVDPADKSPVAALITPDMARMQLAQSAQGRQWKQVALLWVNGVSVPWAALWQGSDARRVALPTYPFARERHWIDVRREGEGARYIASMDSVSAPVVPRPQATAVAAAPARWHFYLPSATAAVQGDASGLSAEDKIALFLKQEVAAQLQQDIDAIATDRDFLELGMNSIGLAEVILRIDRLLSINLSPGVIFRHPEIGSLAAYLADTCTATLEAMVVSDTAPSAHEVLDRAPVDEAPSEPATPAEVVVPLQVRGEKPPIFAVPGAGGSALSLQLLSHALGTQQPFYCLEPAGLDGRPASAEGVEAVAGFNIEAMKRVQPAGPYHLVGYSNGGIVAFEMARSLQARGDEVASLTLLDSLSPALLAREAMEEMTVEVFRHFVGGLGGRIDMDADGLRAIPEAERGERLHALVAAQGIDLPRRQFLATYATATGSERACRAYVPDKLPHPVQVTLFRAVSGFQGVPDDYGWGEFVHGALRTYTVDADHFSLLEHDPIHSVARQMQVPTPVPAPAPPTRPTGASKPAKPGKGNKSARKATQDRADVTA
ncbi:MAG: hypothetical protein KF800_06065 [Lysobacter sp.]|nr:hypothetical protein [Lysobacter sp.]